MNENLPEVSVGTHNEFQCTWYFHSKFHDNLSIRWVVPVLATDIETLVVGPGPPCMISGCICYNVVPCWDYSKHLYQIIKTAQVHLSISTETGLYWTMACSLWSLQQLLTRGRSLNYAKLLHTRSSSGVKRVKSIRSIILHPLDTAVCFYPNPICYG